MTTLYVQSPTLYLAGSGVLIGATSITLTSLTDIYGNVLTMADFGALGYITHEPDTTNAEGATFTGVTANANGTYTLTGVKTILAKSPYTQTSGLVRNHAGGTKVVVTDNVGFWDTFVNKNNDGTMVAYLSGPTPTTGAHYATKTYVDGIAIAGSPVASTLTLGIVKISVNPSIATSPIVVETTDPRVPTQAENDALVGTSGAPSSSNKYVTNNDTGSSIVVGAVVRRNSTGDVTVNTTPTASTDAVSKAYADSLAPQAKTGNTTKDMSATTQTVIAHGLTATPKLVTFHVNRSTADGAWGGQAVYSIGTYDGTTQNCNYVAHSTNGTTFLASQDTTHVIHYGYGTTAGANSDNLIGTASMGSTNILIVWTKTGSPTGTADIIWTAQA